MNPTLASLTDQTPQDIAARLRGTARRATGMNPVTGARIDDQIADQVHSLLDRDLVSVLAEGWQSSRMLRLLAEESREHPRDTFTIELTRQRITHVRRPSFDLYVDRKRVATIGFVVTAVLLLPELAAEVVDGAITAVRFGPGELTVSVSDDRGNEVLPAVHRTFGSSHSVALPRRIPLLGAHHETAAPPVRQGSPAR